MTDTTLLARLIEPEAQALGFELVRVKMTGGKSDPTLQVMAERPDTRQLTIDDCSDLSRRISDRMDALEAEGRDPIEGAYRLEVSSPGIDRPLTRLRDFADWQGHEARIRFVEPIEGAKQVTGDIKGLVGDEVELEVRNKGIVRVHFGNIDNAKLVMTDRLIAATAPLSSAGADEVYEEAPAECADEFEDLDEDADVEDAAAEEQH